MGWGIPRLPLGRACSVNNGAVVPRLNENKLICECKNDEKRMNEGEVTTDDKFIFCEVTSDDKFIFCSSPYIHFKESCHFFRHVQ